MGQGRPQPLGSRGGVRFFGEGKRISSLVMITESKAIRIIDAVHVEG
ncbi:MAG TPA: hypothetical protein VEX64_03725 [Pyrinomonadaceae bacterium]|jgi:fructose-1,6-bisphosphatase/sedoheptulose 1,7-bisphosphatase-like protein|nr:hypothetical protein [Pyrinomonadaceae bacterium]